jgi:hypothetical protein
MPRHFGRNNLKETPEKEAAAGLSKADSAVYIAGTLIL